jgi:hypothetical protein
MTDRLPHASPSQISTWNDCQRKWAYSRVRPRTSNKYAVFGTQTHSMLERWLRDGTPPDGRAPEGACALAGLPYLPLPGIGLVETKLRLDVEGITYIGFVDLIFGLVPGEQITVLDHKTTGNLDYRLTPGHEDPSKDLVTDVQRIIYSHWAAITFAVERVNAVWLYYRRKPPKAVPSVYSEPRRVILERFHEIHRRSTVPMINAHGLPPEELPRNVAACGRYGGCPFREECHRDLDPLELAAQAMRTATPTQEHAP